MTHKSDRSKVKEMVEWFYEEYEDPANGVPYDTGEGGYQYVNGGPYEALEVLSGKYPEYGENLILQAVDEISDIGIYWVKKGQY